MRWQDNLTNDQEKRYNSIHQQRNLLNVLRRSIEIATHSRHYDMLVCWQTKGYR